MRRGHCLEELGNPKVRHRDSLRLCFYQNCLGVMRESRDPCGSDRAVRKALGWGWER